MIREIAILQVQPEKQNEVLRLLEQQAAFRRTRPGCRTAQVNPLAAANPIGLTAKTLLVYAEYDDLKCQVESEHALQAHFKLSGPAEWNSYLLKPLQYGIFEA